MSQVERINQYLREAPESQLNEILDFVMFLRQKKDKDTFHDLLSTSTSSTAFWDNDEDEVWDRV